MFVGSMNRSTIVCTAGLTLSSPRATDEVRLVLPPKENAVPSSVPIERRKAISPYGPAPSTYANTIQNIPPSTAEPAVPMATYAIPELLLKVFLTLSTHVATVNAPPENRQDTPPLHFTV